MNHRWQGQFHWTCVVASIVIGWCAPAVAQSPETTDAALRAYYTANGLLSRGLNEAAVDEYRAFLKASPKHEKAATARYGLGVALFRLNKLDEAITELELIRNDSSFPFAAEVNMLLGQSRMTKQQYAAAAKDLSVVVDAHASHANAAAASSLLIECLYRDSQHKAVETRCEQFIKSWPENPSRERVEYYRALSAIALEDYAAAASTLTAMRRRFPDGPLASQSTLLLAQSLHRAGDADQAARHYRAIIKDGKGDDVAESLFGLASIVQKTKPEEAARLLDRLTESFPTHRLTVDAWRMRGRLWFDAEQYANAQSAFERAAELGGAKDEAAYWIAKCRMKRGDHAGAATALEAAIASSAESPVLPEMFYDRAVSLMKVDRADDAAKSLQQLCERFPDHVLAADATYLLAVLEHNRKNYAASKELCESFVRKHSDHQRLPAVAFLIAENELMAEHDEDAVKQYRRFIKTYPNDDQVAAAHFRVGTALYRLKQYDKAEEALSKVVKGRSTAEPYRRGVLLLGDIRYLKEQWRDAAEAYADFLSFGLDQPSADEALLKCGLAWSRAGDTDQALSQFQQLNDRFPKSEQAAQAAFEQGQILLARKDVDRAAAAFTQVVERNPKSPFAPYALNHVAGMAMQREQFAQAAELYGKVAASAAGTDLAPQAMFQRGQAFMSAKQFDDANSAFAEFISQNAKHALAGPALSQQAIALCRLSRHEDALKVIKRVKRDHAASIEPAALAPLLYEKAWCLRELKQVDEARAAYRQLIELKADHPIMASATLELAELELQADHRAEAAELLDALVAAPSSSSRVTPDATRQQAMYRLAVIRFEDGKFSEAAALSEELLAMQPADALAIPARSLCGESHFKAGHPQKALPHFAAVVERGASDPAYETSLLRLGECQAVTEKWKDSEATFALHRKQFPESEHWFQSQFGIGWARENQDQHDEAMKAYRAVVDKHTGPTAARAQFQIGECLFAMKRHDDAIRELLKVDILYAYPEWSAAALYEAGRCFEELSRAAEAKSHFEQVQQRFPKTQWAELAAKRLASTGSRTASGG